MRQLDNAIAGAPMNLVFTLHDPSQSSIIKHWGGKSFGVSLILDHRSFALMFEPPATFFIYALLFAHIRRCCALLHMADKSLWSEREGSNPIGSSTCYLQGRGTARLCQLSGPHAHVEQYSSQYLNHRPHTSNHSFNLPMHML